MPANTVLQKIPDTNGNPCSSGRFSPRESKLPISTDCFYMMELAAWGGQVIFEVFVSAKGGRGTKNTVLSTLLTFEL